MVFLCDPRWNAAQQAEARALLLATADRSRSAAGESAAGWLCVPTGGSSGTLRFARHDEQTLSAAVEGFVRHFGLSRINAVDVLPPFHVSGLMARVRCAATGGTHVSWDWKRLEKGERPQLPDRAGAWVISLVPTQLQRLLASVESTAWLRRFGVVFVGGGPVWPVLASDAAAAGLRISLSYGMTETAAMVAALKPEEFLAGDRSCGRPMPHARIGLTNEGAIRIEGESVCRGYAPARDESRVFETADLGAFDAHGRLFVLGRRDAVIITGGEKVHPVEVENALRATGAFDDVAVIAAPDAEWGEIIVACYPATKRPPDLSRVRKQLEAELPGFKRPKRYVAVAEWPRNAQGKVSRAVLLAALRQT